jgi:N-carbamoyl-L-amino-acid hydrolase
MELSKLRINGARLRASLEEMAKIGATPGGGVQRLTLSDEDKRGRDQIVAWMKAIDLAVRWATSSVGGPGRTMPCRRS